MLRSAIRTAIRARYGIPDDDGLLTATILDGFIDRAVKRVELAGDWQWLETVESVATVDGTATYPVAVSYVRTISVRVAEATPMVKLTIDEADHWGQTNKGIPKAYALDGRLLRLVPTPNTVGPVLHRFVRTETALASDAAEPLCPEPWIEAVIAAAGVFVYRRTGELDMVGGTDAEYKAIIESLGGRSDGEADTTGGGFKVPAAEPKG